MKTILVTGANRGIGLSLAKHYLSQGWRVLAGCRNPQEADSLNQLLQQQANQLLVFKLDVNDDKSIANLTEQLKQEKIDVLVNNAGVMGPRAPLGKLTSGPWLEVFKVNSIAPVLIVQSLLKQIESSNMKTIVNMSSTLASIGNNNESDYYEYRASKAALNAVTKNLAIDLKVKGITVISIHPGWVKTDMGGENADITTNESVTEMFQVINQLSLKNSGDFLTYEGKLLPW